MNEYSVSAPLRRCHVRLTTALFSQFGEIVDRLVEGDEYRFIDGGECDGGKRQWMIFLVDEAGAERVAAFLQARRVREKGRMR